MNYHITIDSVIGPGAYSKQTLRRLLAPYAGRHVDVCISSLGGDLFHALDIRQQFIDHGDVTVYLSGAVASAATVIAMGAKHVKMGRYAFFLVHKCSNFLDVWGAYNADQMQNLITQLETNKKENDMIDVTLAGLYADRCGKKIGDILPILKAGRWMSADEALSHGFVDEIVDIDNRKSADASGSELLAKLNTFGLPTLGLESLLDSTDDSVAGQSLLGRIARRLGFTDNDKKSTKTSKPMSTLKANHVASLLKVDAITPDDDGTVSISAARLEIIDSHIAALETAAAAHKDDIAAKDAEISRLNAQITALQKSPGATTDDIEDPSGVEALSADELFNSIKHVL